MKMYQKALIMMLTAIFVIFLIPAKPAHAEESIYGHISFVDNEATVTRQDKTENKAIVNLPVVPGDTITTGENGRCELQFGNGTVIRIDKNSRLDITTVLAPSLTSRWKITTLNLSQGQLYTISQTYNSEMFQVITPNAAFNLKSSSTSIIRIKENGDTFTTSERGKFNVMFGKNSDNLKTETVKSGEAYVITADHQIKKTTEEKKDIDFIGWNEYITKNFKELHNGISKVPPMLNSFKNNALTYWAEKWSSAFGEWVYDDLFGYVWRPYDEIFALSERPFFNADFVQVNGQTFVVPQQAWGWVPAHLGTWVWLKRGWTWVPGDAFQCGACRLWNSYYYPTLEYYISAEYGDYRLYTLYRTHGYRYWKNEYYRAFNRYPKDPNTKNLPKSVGDIVGRINKASLAALNERFANNNRPFINPIEKSKILGVFGEDKRLIQPGGSDAALNTVPIRKEIGLPSNPSNPNNGSKATMKTENINREFKGNNDNSNRTVKATGFRDFNPDRRWSIDRNVEIKYSSERNAVVAPGMRISSRDISTIERLNLKNSNGGYTGGGYYNNNTNGHTNSTGVSNGNVVGHFNNNATRGNDAAPHNNNNNNNREKR